VSRVTEDDWFCQRCLDKLAEMTEPSLSSASQLHKISGSASIDKRHKMSASAHTHASGFPPSGSAPNVTADSISSSYSSQRFDNFDNFAPNKLEINGQVPTTHNRKAHELSLGHQSPSAVPHHTLPIPNTILAAKYAHDSTLTAVRSSVNGALINNPYFDGRPPKPPPSTTTVNFAADSSMGSAPASPVVAPAVVDRAIHSWTDHALDVSSNDVTRRDPSLAKVSQAVHHSPSEDGSTIAFREPTLTVKNELACKASNEHYGAISIGSRKGGQRNNALVIMAGGKIPESPYFSKAIMQPLVSFESTPDETTHTTKRLSAEMRKGHGSNSELPAKKLCSQCRRLILGCTSLCTKCRQMDDKQSFPPPEKNCGNDGAGAVDSLRMAKTVQPTTARELGVPKALHLTCKNTITEESSTRQSRFQDGVASPLTTYDPKAISDSPVVPETPDLMFVKQIKNFETSRSEETNMEADQYPTRTLIPQKRTASVLNVNDNDHCFSKKKPRIFKPTAQSIAANWPSMRSKHFPPTPKSDSPRFEYVSRDASVQTGVETVAAEDSGTPQCDGNVAGHGNSTLRADRIESARQWSMSDEKALLNALRNRGVIFEEGSSSESDVSLPPPRTKAPPKDPLWRCPQSSSDLFLIAPSLRANHPSFDVEQRKQEIAARPLRKKRRLDRSYLRQERGENIHEEVKRDCPPRMVNVSSSTTPEFQDMVDRNVEGMASGQESHVEMSFGDFVGVPANPLAILTEDKRLAYRDGTRDAKGALPRARERFIVTNRSVVCMEK
jgi:hypothetical protein